MNIEPLERLRREIRETSHATIHHTNSNLGNVSALIPTGTNDDKPIVIGVDATDFWHAEEILYHERKGKGSIKLFRSFFGFTEDGKKTERIYFNSKNFRSFWFGLPTDYTDKNPVAKGFLPEKNELLMGRVEEGAQGNFFETWGVAPTKNWEKSLQIINIPGELELNYKHYSPVFNDAVWDAWIFATVFNDLVLYRQIRDTNLARMARNAIRSWNPRLKIN